MFGQVGGNVNQMSRESYTQYHLSNTVPNTGCNNAATWYLTLHSLTWVLHSFPDFSLYITVTSGFLDIINIDKISQEKNSVQNTVRDVNYVIVYMASFFLY